MARFSVTTVLFWICILVPLVSCKSNVFGSFGKSITLKCPLKPVSRIAWYDWVYNLDGSTPAPIFTSGSIVEDEYRQGRISVDINTGNLKITGLTDDDVGTYFCQTSPTDKHEFNLILAEMPMCSGQVQGLHEKDETKLECNMKYSGDSAPKLEWLREDEIIESTDMNQIGVAKQSADVSITYDMDKNNFICRAVLGEMVEECTLQFEVFYPVREPKIEPKKEMYVPGTKITCIGNGNPVANVRISTTGEDVKNGEGRVDFQIPVDWDQMDAFIFCEVDNIVEGVPAYKQYNHTFKVASPSNPNTGKSVESISSGTPEHEPTEGDNKLAAIVAGLVIGGVLLVIIIVVVVCIRRRNANKPPKGSKPVPTKEENVRGETIA